MKISILLGILLHFTGIINCKVDGRNASEISVSAASANATNVPGLAHFLEIVSSKGKNV
jgi:hypothetical protein